MSAGKTYGVPEPHDLGLGQHAVKGFTRSARVCRLRYPHVCRGSRSLVVHCL